MEEQTAGNHRIRVELTDTGVLVRLANTKHVFAGSMTRRLLPEPREIFEAGLIACAAIATEEYMRRNGLPATGFEIEPRIASSPSGCSILTLHYDVPGSVGEGDRTRLRAEVISACARFAPASCGFRVELVFERSLADQPTLRHLLTTSRRTS